MLEVVRGLLIARQKLAYWLDLRFQIPTDPSGVKPGRPDAGRIVVIDRVPRELKWRKWRIFHGGASSGRLWLRARRWPPAASSRQALPRPRPRISRPDGAGRQTSW